ncbi:MAG: 30S ribosomal protein S20 [Chloroflexota bacterium]
MANIKSAEKRNRQNIKRREHNRTWIGGSRTAIKKARALIEAGDPGAADAVAVANRTLDKAASKGVIHKNNAARRKSRLMAALHAMAE